MMLLQPDSIRISFCTQHEIFCKMTSSANIIDGFVQVDIESISHLRRLPPTLQALHLEGWYGHGSRTIWRIGLHASCICIAHRHALIVQPRMKHAVLSQPCLH
jgi:hypothetical protein